MIKQCLKFPINCLVAKYNGQELWLPFQMHLMDTVGVMEKLVSHWLPSRIIEMITEYDSEIEISQLCRFIALVHDIGKATPVFQAKICDGFPARAGVIPHTGTDPQWSASIPRASGGDP